MLVLARGQVVTPVHVHPGEVGREVLDVEVSVGKRLRDVLSMFEGTCACVRVMHACMCDTCVRVCVCVMHVCACVCVCVCVRVCVCETHPPPSPSSFEPEKNFNQQKK